MCVLIRVRIIQKRRHAMQMQTNTIQETNHRISHLISTPARLYHVNTTYVIGFKNGLTDSSSAVGRLC